MGEEDQEKGAKLRSPREGTKRIQDQMVGLYRDEKLGEGKPVR